MPLLSMHTNALQEIEELKFHVKELEDLKSVSEELETEEEATEKKLQSALCMLVPIM